MQNSFLDKKRKIKNLKNGVGIKALLDEAYEILGNPIMMFDTSYTLLMSNDVVTDDWVWNEIATVGTFKHETIDFFNQEHFIEDFAISETVAFMKSRHLKYERANGKLFDKDNVQLGNISIVACFKPFEDGDMELIEIFCEILSVELQKSEMYQKIDRVYQESVIDQIINGDITENDVNTDMLEKLYDGVKTNIYLAVVDITQYDKTNTHLAYFRDLFKKMQKEHRYYVHLNNIIIIISSDNDIIDMEYELKELSEFFKKYNMYAGISSMFQNIFELRKCFREAITALHYGLDSRRNQNIFSYDDFRIEHFLASSIEDLKEICSPIILSIQKYDSDNNSNLLDVLYIYLLYGMDALLACKHLDMSSEELTDKLKKINNMFNIDWKNGNILYNIFLSIKLLNRQL